MSHILNEIITNLSLDCVILGFEKARLEVLLIQRAIEPCKGMWALPGGFIQLEERVTLAADRILKATTGVEGIYLEEIGVFDRPDRYPGRRVLTIGHFALISPENYALAPGIDTSAVRWFDLAQLPPLPFDHREILDFALEKLRKRIRERPIGFELLPAKFTLPRLQALYEAILGTSLDKRNFRKKIMRLGVIKQLHETDPESTRRAASLYSFDADAYDRLREEGLLYRV
jgi:ADP-ribose pyrophosphatase YjhB (NUDIX family)